jgi:hypothetical protein
MVWLLAPECFEPYHQVKKLKPEEDTCTFATSLKASINSCRIQEHWKSAGHAQALRSNNYLSSNEKHSSRQEPAGHKKTENAMKNSLSSSKRRL